MIFSVRPYSIPPKQVSINAIYTGRKRSSSPCSFHRLSVLGSSCSSRASSGQKSKQKSGRYSQHGWLLFDRTWERSPDPFPGQVFMLSGGRWIIISFFKHSKTMRDTFRRVEFGTRITVGFGYMWTHIFFGNNWTFLTDGPWDFYFELSRMRTIMEKLFWKSSKKFSQEVSVSLVKYNHSHLSPSGI